MASSGTLEHTHDESTGFHSTLPEGVTINLRDLKTRAWAPHTGDVARELDERGIIIGDRVTFSDGTLIGNGAKIRDDVWTGAGAVIHDGAILGHGVQVGQRACVREGARIGTGAVVSAGATVGEYVRVGEHAIIDARALVGSGAQIGEGAHIGEGARVYGATTIAQGVAIAPGARLRNAYVERTTACQVVGPLGAERGMLTGYWSNIETPEIMVSFEGVSQPLHVFEMWVARTGPEHREAFTRALEYLKAAITPFEA